MMRVTVVRALVLAAVFAAALPPVTCLAEDSNPLPARATKELSPELLSLLRQKKMPKHSPILLRIFKEEAELEVWKQDTTGRFQMLKTYPICRWSGDLGPKLHEDIRTCGAGLRREHVDIRRTRARDGYRHDRHGGLAVGQSVAGLHRHR